MPELPEVETTCRGIAPHVTGQTISDVIIRQAKLRWMIDNTLPQLLNGQTIESVERRAKYVMLNTTAGTLLIHLGMTGSLRVLNQNVEPDKHEHLDIVFENGQCLRFRDPRKFGAVLWGGKHPEAHNLIAHLGPEPLGDEFDGLQLFNASRNRKMAVKQFIMDGKVVVGVGNIYASESLFASHISPEKPANQVTRKQYDVLANEIKLVLARAIECGGTTLKDFVSPEGKSGYFSIELQVYGREGLPCYVCKSDIKKITQGQRSTFFCPKCQAKSKTRAKS